MVEKKNFWFWKVSRVVVVLTRDVRPVTPQVHERAASAHHVRRYVHGLSQKPISVVSAGRSCRTRARSTGDPPSRPDAF